MVLYTDEEFKNLIPPLTSEEYKQLEENILNDGIRDPFVIWLSPLGARQGESCNECYTDNFKYDADGWICNECGKQFPLEYILIDGHNRYEIAQKHGLEFDTVELDIMFKEDVKVWIINNQFGRRNINNYQRSVLALKLEDVYREKAKANQIRKPINSVLQNSAEQIDTRSELAKTAKVSRDTISRVKKIEAKATPEIKALLNSGEMHINKAFSEIKKQERKDEIEKQKEDIRQGKIEMPIGTFETIVIDPPWSYGREYDPDGSRVANPYPEMAQEQLKELKIPASDDCVIWLWTTQAFIWDAHNLLKHWGFTYKAILTWDKENIGMGAWLRMQTEFCLLGIKGKPLWGITNMRDIIREPRREHSRKPETFYELIDNNFVGRKLDYFSRNTRNGWDVMGNDINKFNDGMEG